MTFDWFCYDGDGGFEEFATEKEAREAAEEWLDEYLCDGEWEDAAERVCWGRIYGLSQSFVDTESGYVDIRIVPRGDGGSQ